ncbi:MAG: TetR/AcrR family transcriptional regulator [Planctomycetota bacterium]|jgi:AcrR family transcriptional regulator
MSNKYHNSSEQPVPEDARNRLLDAAEKLFCKKGFHAVSVRELTTEAGCNIAAVNYHFGGKEKLYTEMFRRQFEMMIQGHLEAIDRVMSESNPSLEKLLWAVMEPPIRRVMNNETGGKILRLLVREVLDQKIDSEYIARDMKEKLFDRLGQVFMELVSGLAEEKITLIVMSFDGVILHPFLFMEFYQKTIPDLTIDGLIDHMVRFVAAGIRGYAVPIREGS